VTDPELEQRLQRIDPAADTVPVDTAGSPRARTLMEQIMQTTPAEAPPSHRRRWVGVGAAIVGAAAVVALGVAVVNRGSDTPEQVSASYSLQAGDAMAMCLPLSEAPPPPAGTTAFGGVVATADAEQVVLDVDQVYAGDEVDVVTLAAGPDVTTVALDGVEFVPGQRYLVTVVDGVVQICGRSGQATPELEAIYISWFGQP
jgi:hypothetical protein